MLTTTTPYQRSLGNNLLLKSIRDRADVERLAAFNDQIHGGSEVAAMTRALMLHYPATRPEEWLYIEDESSGQIVSSLVVLPWTLRYEDITLKAGEMGIVGTLEAYRHRGLVRTLVARFKELLREGDYDLSPIQGIPYFYRQFGYEYAMPLNAGWQIELHNLLQPSASPSRFQAATTDDIPVLARLYDAMASALDITAVRTEGDWTYLFEHTAGTSTEGDIGVVLDADDQVIGYWRVSRHGFGKGLIVSETSRLSYAAAEALALHLKTIAIERDKPGLHFNLPLSNDLLQAARTWGAQDAGNYAWQIHLVDVARLLRKLAPVLERRLAASLYSGLTQKVNLNLYHETVELDFRDGKLASVTSIGFKEGGAIRIPPLLLAPLLLGWRSREELAHSHPDVAIWGSSQLLVDTLFPKMDSFIFPTY